MAALGRSHATLGAFAVAVLSAWCVAFFAYLLARFPYDGLYGQDSYAYYYQARAILHDITGQPPQPWQLFSSDQLYHWPIGYHIHLILGQIISGGVAGGRAITLFTAVGAAIILYLLVGELWPTASRRARVLSGLVAGAALPLVATYTRMGLSLMADVPALFWGLLGIYCCLRTWPLPSKSDACDSHSAFHVPHSAFALMGGLSLGIAVLTRYASVFFVIPIIVYLLICRFSSHSDPHFSFLIPHVALVVAGFVLGILPQVAYLLAHNQIVLSGDVGDGYSAWLNNWSPANLFATTVTGPDGTSTFPQPMIVFYLLQPFYDTDAGFLSGFYLPGLLLGLAVFVRHRMWAVMGLLTSWWLLPVLFFGGTPYQAHRFALTYLPVLLILTGIGAAAAVELALQTLHEKGLTITTAQRPTSQSPLASRPSLFSRVLSICIAVVVLIGLALGAYKGQGSVKGWMAIHESFKVDEQEVLTLARRAAGTYTPQDPPRLVAFGLTGALYHYTQWPTIELYNSDEPVIARFLDAPGPHLLVLPEATMSGQWANTPLAARWEWMQQTYNLMPQGKADTYTVYKVEERH